MRGMGVVRRLVEAPVEDVWATLSDGWLYPLFVVGASRMREVDDGWPAVGTELHHSFGAWPALVDDTTQVVQAVPPTMLRLVARGRPGGEAGVLFVLHEVEGGTEVVLEEDVVSGPARLVPKLLRDPAMKHRNTETLRRLAYVAERRTRPGDTSDQPD